VHVLNKIQSPADVKALAPEQLSELCSEIRAFLVDSVSRTGGHLASNLGAVELTVAIHRVFDTEKDRLVFDVGHQCYVHKLLTGRREAFSTLRRFGGLAGFPKPSESVHDAFIAGHASNAISVALGLARARTHMGADHSVIAFVGDGALTGGLAYEALCDAGGSGEPLIVILNDNGIAITPNVGAMARHLEQQRIKPGYLSFKYGYRKVMNKLPGGKVFYRLTHRIKTAVKGAFLHANMFEEMGFQYLGPVDGHDVKRLTQLLAWAKNLNAPVLIHAITKKGKGYAFSEEAPRSYHGVPPFDPTKGVPPVSCAAFSDVFGETLTELAEQDPRILALTAAMTYGTGLQQFAARYPDRFFDVGIAEEHAVSMASGAAAGGMIPVFAVYSTFLQRAYDMLLHDMAILNEHVVLAVDRAGLVGADGETHQGIFDVSYLSAVPGMTIYSPASFAELRDMLRCAVLETVGPAAVRYPKGAEGRYTEGGALPIRTLRAGEDCTILTYGIQVNTALDAADLLAKEGIRTEIIKLGVLAPLDLAALARAAERTGRILVLEECIKSGSLGQRLGAFLAESGSSAKIVMKNLGSDFVAHGTVEELRALCGIDAESVAAALREMLR